jgi:hypothetical protein
MHGIATLWRDGSLPPQFTDPVALARALAPLLFQSSGRPGGPADRHPVRRCCALVLHRPGGLWHGLLQAGNHQ